MKNTLTFLVSMQYSDVEGGQLYYPEIKASLTRAIDTARLNGALSDDDTAADELTVHTKSIDSRAPKQFTVSIGYSALEDTPINPDECRERLYNAIENARQNGGLTSSSVCAEDLIVTLQRNEVSAGTYFGGEDIDVDADALVLIPSDYLVENNLSLDRPSTPFTHLIPKGKVAAYAGSFGEWVPIVIH